MYDNIGSPYFGDDVAEAAQAVASGALRDGQRVVAYHRNYSDAETGEVRNTIYELVRDDSAEGGVARRVLMRYAVGENSSLNGENLNRVVGDARELVPADHYGFAFGSHGLGWVPKSNTYTPTRRGGNGQSYEHPFAELWEPRENPRTRFFMSESFVKLDVSEFVAALDDWSWDFMILDDCFMSSIEALYDMRRLADYIVASPTEIMIPGFPYGRVVSTLFQSWESGLEASLAGVADAFVEDYRTGRSGTLYRSLPCATVAVVKMSELDALARSVRDIVQSGSLVSIADPVAAGIQVYEGYSRPAHIFYDLDDYIARATTNAALYTAFGAQLRRTVTFADHTDNFYSDYPSFSGSIVTVKHFSGLNAFIPWSGTTLFTADYQQTNWYKDIYL
jgi:hypothetical protein